MSNNISIQSLDPLYQGDTRLINVTLTDSNGVAFDITNDTLTITIKESISSPSAVHEEIRTAHDDPTNGKTTFTIPPATTADFKVVNHIVSIVWETSTGLVTTILYRYLPIIRQL